MDVNWLELPEDIIVDIAGRLTEIDDFVRFGFVCKLWQSISIVINQTRKEKKWFRFSPWMLLPEGEINTQDDANPNNNHVRKFFCVYNGKIVNSNLPESRGRRCFGSPFGWLLTIGLDLNIHLLNPLTRSQISLPSQPTFQHQYECHVEPKKLRRIFIPKFALSSSPGEGNCVVMVIYSQFRKLAFVRTGDASWISIESPPRESHKDVICFKDQFYVVTVWGKVKKIADINTPHPRTVNFMPPPEDVQSSENFYLVEMCGDLHLVVRIFRRDKNAPQGVLRYETIMFEVYKLDFITMKWIELLDLGDYALFVGTNASFAVLTSNNPEIKPNSIYFTDDQDDFYKNGDGGGHDTGVFDFPNETIERFYLGEDIYSSYCPPLFFIPSLV